MNFIPANWSLIDEYDGSLIFENSDKSFCVNIDYTPACDYPYSISFIQLKGQFTLIGIENGRYSAHSRILQDAYCRAGEMMSFIDLKIGGIS